MEETSAAKLLSAEDVVLEILHRVSTDAAALFRCAVACKRWRALVADRSFLRRCWPESAGQPSTLLGFFDRQTLEADARKLPRLFFVPPPAGSVLGAQRRLVTSMVNGLPEDDSHFAEPLAARRGLLLVRLISMTRITHLSQAVHMAVCDPVTSTCHLLPPLECRVTYVSGTLLTGADCRHHPRSSSLQGYFKVLAMVSFSSPRTEDDEDREYYNLYTFSSTESRWSAPTKCLDKIVRLGKGGFLPPQRADGNVVHGAMAHWLVPYYFHPVEEPPRYYLLDVSADDTCDRTSLTVTELPIPANQLMSRPTLRVPADGSLSLFCVDDEAPIWRLHTWKRGNGVDSEVWLHTRAIDLNLPTQPRHFWNVRMMLVEKSDKIFIIGESQFLRKIDDKSKPLFVHKIDVETGEVEEQQFQNTPGILAVAMNIEWPTLFASRLGQVLE
jgi:hypothetical protein